MLLINNYYKSLRVPVYLTDPGTRVRSNVFHAADDGPSGSTAMFVVVTRTTSKRSNARVLDETEEIGFTVE